MNPQMTKQETLQAVSKAQWVRLVDIYFLGPFMIFLALNEKKMCPYRRSILGLFGATTIWYNFKNYRDNRERLQTMLGEGDEEFEWGIFPDEIADQEAEILSYLDNKGSVEAMNISSFIPTRTKRERESYRTGNENFPTLKDIEEYEKTQTPFYKNKMKEQRKLDDAYRFLEKLKIEQDKEAFLRMVDRCKERKEQRKKRGGVLKWLQEQSQHTPKDSIFLQLKKMKQTRYRNKERQRRHEIKIKYLERKLDRLIKK